MSQVVQVRSRGSVVPKEQQTALWALLPEELSALGFSGNANHLFRALQRPWTWTEQGPAVGKATQAFLRENTDVSLPSLVERHTSQDGATRVVIGLRDGERIEAVHMPRDVRSPRVSICLSSQVGCAMGCGFCATASMGLKRNLTASEIVGQVLVVLRELGPQSPDKITLVFMGMGEPLHNFDSVVRAIRVLCHPAGLGLSPNRITVSTSGLVTGIEKLTKVNPRPLLALSLNATTDESRRSIMPVNDTWGLERLRQALLMWPLRNGEKLTIEYVLLAGVNDSAEDAVRLAAWVQGMKHNLNVIPYNEYPTSLFKETPEEKLQAFVQTLQQQGALVTVRRSRGRDVQAACGQLVKRANEDKAIPPNL